MKIHKDDIVQVTSGKDKGKTGKVEKVFPKKAKVLVAGINVYKRHRKPQGEGRPGGIIEINKPLPMGNVALLCPKCQKPTRVGYQIDKPASTRAQRGGQGKKSRICKKCKGLI